MEEAFVQFCDHLSSNLWLQSLLVVAGTCFIEDPARCAVGLLVAAGHIGWWLAFASMTAGGMAGDIGLYVIGRYGTQLLQRWRWVDPARLLWMEDYFQHHALKSVLVARFLPGARTVVYLSAGAVRYPFGRFLALLFATAAVQALIFLRISEFIAARILPYLRDPRLRFAVFALIVLLMVLAHHEFARRRKRRLAAAPLAESAGPGEAPAAG